MNIAEKVTELAGKCLHGHLDGSLEVKVIVSNFCFDKDAITAHKEEIRALLNEMPDEFHAGRGGGMSFLNLCNDKHGNQWTGLHQTMEQLVALGIAAGLAQFCLPREFWKVLPGGMPYIVFETDKP